MPNKRFILIVAVAAILAMPAVTQAQAPLDFESIAKNKVIPLPKGDPRPLLALAAKYGQARGEITGEAAELIKKKTGSNAKIMITAQRIGDVPAQPGCKKVRLTYSSTAESTTQSGKTSSIDTSVCPASLGEGRQKK